MRLDPKDAIAYCNRGNAYLQKGDLDRAIADYSETMRLKPDCAAEVYFGRGTAYFQQEEYVRARAALDAALRLKSDYPETETLSAALREKGF